MSTDSHSPEFANTPTVSPTTGGRKSHPLLLAAAPALLILGLAVAVGVMPTFNGSDRDITPIRDGANPPIRPRTETPHRANRKTQRAIEKVVRGQMAALQDGEWAQALTFAIDEVRTSTPADQFGLMIQREFAPLTHYRTVAFQPARILSQQSAVDVTITQPDNTKVGYHYVLRNDRAGWRVATVQPLRPTGFVPREEGRFMRQE